MSGLYCSDAEMNLVVNRHLNQQEEKERKAEIRRMARDALMSSTIEMMEREYRNSEGVPISYTRHLVEFATRVYDSVNVIAVRESRGG